ncbi:hypothetical protein F511_37889 [Dorcoceras hygrometricum]|uniref:Uncharacterized protein n=1 Tax=Dorcoceras hygrometricum TaxID=472368 RepID=A0A2Z7C0D0_9LAMI|nr:hypothetical protein F511_37889 [Dorcoceras hygrometricum]
MSALVNGTVAGDRWIERSGLVVLSAVATSSFWDPKRLACFVLREQGICLCYRWSDQMSPKRRRLDLHARVSVSAGIECVRGDGVSVFLILRVLWRECCTAIGGVHVNGGRSRERRVDVESCATYTPILIGSSCHCKPCPSCSNDTCSRSAFRISYA